MPKQMVSATDDGERIWWIYIVFAADNTMASVGRQTVSYADGIIYRLVVSAP
jgi:hypothetical protein